MMTPEESALVLARIHAHHGNAPMTKLQAECFHEELRPYVTLQVALDAVREYYAKDTTGRWMGSGDVNAYARRVHADSVPSDADIERMAAELGVPGDVCRWQFRRTLLKALGGGEALMEAVRLAVEESRSPALPAQAGRKTLDGPSDTRTLPASNRDAHGA